MNKLGETLKIADIHVSRINLALNHINHLFPLKADQLKNLRDEEMAWIDLLINRFGKLQDIIGSKIIDLFLIHLSEAPEEMTMLDKLHKLEKIGILDDVEIWKKFRLIRNHVAHEYPDNPEIMALNINQIFDNVGKLLNILENIKLKLGSF